MTLPLNRNKVTVTARSYRPLNARGNEPRKVYEYQGRFATLSQLCAMTGTKLGTAFARLRKGWTIERAIKNDFPDLSGVEKIPVPNFDGYFCDTEGNVYSNIFGSLKKLRPGVCSTGYPMVVLSRAGKRITINVATVVAMAFFGERPIGLTVNHKDGDKLNSRPINLEYVTQSENNKHAYATGLKKPSCGNQKLTDETVREIRLQAAPYFSDGKFAYGERKRLSEKFGISRVHLQGIVTFRTRKVAA